MLRDRIDKFGNLFKYKIIYYYEIRFHDEIKDRECTFRTFLHSTFISKMQELSSNNISFIKKIIAITEEQEQS